MKRTDFLKSLVVPFVFPLLPRKEEKPGSPGDIFYYDGKDMHIINSAHSESYSKETYPTKDLNEPYISVYRGCTSAYIPDSAIL